MALYRLKGATGNDYPYVYTNPDSATLITHRDCAFVLGADVPSSLQGDSYQMMEKEGTLNLGFEKKENVSGGALDAIVPQKPASFQPQTTENEESILGIKAAKHQTTHVQAISRKLENSVKQLERIANDLETKVTQQDQMILSTVHNATKNYLEKYRINKPGED